MNRLFENSKIKEKIGENLAVICPFRLQSDILKRSFRHLHKKKISIIEMGKYLNTSTVDAFQGREKDVVIFNVVKENKHITLKSYKRLNVAVTRARKKLIILGSKSICIKNLPHFYELYHYIQQNGKIISAPQDINKEIHIVKKVIAKKQKNAKEKKKKRKVLTSLLKI